MKNILLTGVLLLAITLAQGQSYYFEDFSSASGNNLPSNMASVDSDGDGNEWATVDYGDGQGLVATSASWVQAGPLTPDNWMITPSIDLSGASGTVFLEWLAKAQDQNWANENYTVYVAEADSINAFTSSSTTFNEVIGATNDEYVSRSIDVTSFIGDTIFVAFRHHNVSNQFRLNIDDIEVRTIAPHEVAMQELAIANTGLDGNDVDITGTVLNDGANPITAMDITWTDGNNSYTDNLTGLNVAPGATYEFTHSTPLTISGGTNYNLDVSVAMQNDANTNNNSLSDTVIGCTFQTNNAVVIEEGTGTWCGWCPRGMVAMDYMYENYGDAGFIGIAVHNSDPMAVTEYDNGANFSGYPNMNVNRQILGAGVSQNNMEIAYSILIDRVEIAEVSVTEAEINEDTTEMTVELESKFAANLTGNYQFAVVIMEDSVTGTSSGYDQVNYYAGGGQGPMGGYENLPDPVPADQMVYNDVGRMLLGGYNGQPLSMSNLMADSTYSTSFTAQLPPNFDPTQLTAVGLLLDESGRIVNANKMEMSIASPSTAVEDVAAADNISIYPNPTSDVANLYIEASESNTYSVVIYDVAGKQVTEINTMNVEAGSNQKALNTESLGSGMYYVTLTTDNGKRLVKPLVVE